MSVMHITTAAPATHVLAWRRLPLLMGAATLLLHVATAGLWDWDYFRDELYYVACGQHLGLGYVDHPPLVGWIARLATTLFGNSLWAIRLLPALAGGLTVGCAVDLCGRFGGGRAARVLTGVATALAPIYVGIFGVFSMNSFDILVWTAGLALVARILEAGPVEGARLWPAFGLLVGVGLLNKISVLFLGFGLVVGLVLAREWGHFRQRRFWLAGLLAGLIFAPHLVWQAAHDWPTLEFMHNASTFKNVALSPLTFLFRQVEQLNVLTAPLWIAGLAFLLFAPAGRRWRALGWAYLAVLGLMLTQNAKPYYLSPIYPLLFAAGAAWLGRATEASRGRVLPLVPWLATGIIAVSGLALAPLAKPLLPVERYVTYARALGQAPSTDERKEVGRLPQHFADRRGWEALAVTVSDVYTALPPADRERACVFGQNYGQAGALEFYAKDYDLPPAISAHNSYWLWGPGACTGDVLIVLDDRRERLEELFASVEQGALYTCQDCMPYENNKPVWVCRGPKQEFDEIWPAIKHFD